MKRTLILLLIILLGLSLVSARKYRSWIPYYNHYFSKYDYRSPDDSNDFIIKAEQCDCLHPDESEGMPVFIRSILEAAFPEKNIVFSKEQRSHLIIRHGHFTNKVSRKGLLVKNVDCKEEAPYIVIQDEKTTLPSKKFKDNGIPLFVATSRDPERTINDREFYFPFILWFSIKPNRVFIDNKDRKFLAYINSNCKVKEREKLFALIKAKKPSAEALGACSNPNNNRAPGGYRNTDQTYAKYDFGFAMENEQYPGYITEKIFNVFRGGAIPIYWGDSKTLEKFFNTKAYIDVGKFKTLEEAADYIVDLSNDPKRVKKMKEEPIFKDGKMPDLFKMDPSSKPYLEAGNFLRKQYIELLKKNGVPTKSLKVSHNPI